MNVLISTVALTLFATDAVRSVSGSIFDIEDYELQSCERDHECASAEFCSETLKCVNCYECRDFNRVLDSETPRKCAKSVKDCGNCLPGYELERCPGGRYCEKCIRSPTSPPPPGKDPPLVQNNYNVEDRKGTDSAWIVAIATIGVGLMAALVGLSVFLLKKGQERPVRRTSFEGSTTSSAVSTPMLEKTALPQLRQPAYNQTRVNVESMNEYLINMDERQRAVPFYTPQASYHGRSYPTAPPISVAGSSEDARSADGSTVPSNWEPHDVPAADCPVPNVQTVSHNPPNNQTGNGLEQVDSSSYSFEHSVSVAIDNDRVVEWIQQLRPSVSESSVATTSARGEEPPPPSSFVYRSESGLPGVSLNRSSSTTIFSSPAGISDTTLDSGFGPSRPRSGNFSVLSNPFALFSPSSSDNQFELEFGVILRRVPRSDPQ